MSDYSRKPIIIFSKLIQWIFQKKVICPEIEETLGSSRYQTVGRIPNSLLVFFFNNLSNELKIFTFLNVLIKLNKNYTMLNFLTQNWMAFPSVGSNLCENYGKTDSSEYIYEKSLVSFCLNILSEQTSAAIGIGFQVLSVMTDWQHFKSSKT